MYVTRFLIKMFDSIDYEKIIKVDTQPKMVNSISSKPTNYFVFVLPFVIEPQYF